MRPISFHRQLSATAITIALATICLAHEGHQPLPTRGVDVDVAKGKVTLSDSSRRLIGVETTTVTQGQLTQRLPALASVVVPWDRRAVVTSRVAGRVEKLFVRPGDAIKAGDPIAEVRSPELDQLRASIETARNAAQSAREILKGLTESAATGAVPGQRLVEAELALRQAENEERVLLARARMLQVIPDDTGGALPDSVFVIRSPITGTVMHSDLALDKFVDPADHVMEIVDNERVDVRLEIPERDWSRVDVGQSVELFMNSIDRSGTRESSDGAGLVDGNLATSATALVSSGTRQSSEGTAGVTEVWRLPLRGRSNAILALIETRGGMPDRESRQTLAWAAVDNAGLATKLVPGMNGYAELTTAAPEMSLLIPTSAIMSDGAERYVFLEVSKTSKVSRYYKTPVVVGRESHGQTEILAGGITPGDQILTHGGHELSSIFVLGVLRLSPESERSIGLQVAAAEPGDIDTVLTLDGRVDLPPDQRAEISAGVAGTLTSIAVRRGQAVSPNEVLGTISSVPAQELQLQLLKAHLDWTAWNETLERRRSAEDALSRRTLIETESQVRELQIQIDSLQRQLLAAGLTTEQIQTLLKDGTVVDSIPLTSPISGVVSDFSGVLGQLIAPDQPVLEVHDTRQLQVQAFVREQDTPRVVEGQTVRVRLDAFPGKPIEGTVHRKSPILQSQSRAQAVWVQLDKNLPDGIQHAMTARVTVTIASEPAAVTIADAAIVRDGLQAFVFVRQPDGAFERRRVRIGRSDDRRVEIVEGLAVDESVAVSGVQQLQTAWAAVR